MGNYCRKIWFAGGYAYRGIMGDGQTVPMDGKQPDEANIGEPYTH